MVVDANKEADSRETTVVSTEKAEKQVTFPVERTQAARATSSPPSSPDIVEDAENGDTSFVSVLIRKAVHPL